MPAQNKLGVFWGEEGISLVEVAKDVPLKSAFVPFGSLESSTQSVTEDARLLELLQKTVRNQGFSAVDAYFSLPSKDIIVRWFMIPWVKPNEVQGVVAFESRKYIPFQLEELVYTYYPSTITKGENKKIGILFVGIRKEAFKRYSNVLSQSGLNVVYSEPTSMSLLRALVFRRVVTTDNVCAVLRLDKDYGEINIVSQGLVKFIRDFKLSSIPLGPNQEDNAEASGAKLYNEVRVSLDFFNRQQSDGEVGRLVAFSQSADKSLCVGLGEDLGMPVFPVDTQYLMDRMEEMDMGAACAFGAALSGSVRQVIDLNLCEGDSSTAIVTEKKSSLNQSPSIVVVSALLCAGLFAGIHISTESMLNDKKTRLTSIRTSLGTFSGVPLEDIESKKTKERKVISSIQSLELRTTLTPLLVRVIKLLPKDMWLTAINVSYKDAKENPQGKRKGQSAADKPAAGKTANKGDILMVMSGNIYVGDSNAEFEQVNEFISLLKNDSQLSSYFTDVKLMSLKSESEGKEARTAFTINLQ